MEVVHERCCGVDVHKQFITACLIVPGSTGKVTKEVQTFRTMTADLEHFRDWLLAAGCTHVAMESTGVYWKPLYNLLEETNLTVLVVNAQHIKQVPGRKTDVRDCEWIADLLRHGLLQASFIPDHAQRELRELTRYRTSLIQERAAEVNRVQLPWVEASPPGPTEDVGGCQYQAGSGDQGHHGGLGARDPGGTGGGLNRCRRHGEAGTGEAT